jgi:hypothetical protein
VIGNSHAYDLSYALTGNGFNGNILLLSTGGECFNFGYQAVSPSASGVCAANEKHVLDSPALRNASVVYMHDSWAGVDVVGLKQMVDLIRERTAAPIFIFGPKMLFSASALEIRRAAAAAGKTRPAEVNAFAQSYAHLDRIRLDHDLASVVSAWRMPGVTYVSSMNAQCGEHSECDILSRSGAYLYFDNNHFTLEGAHAFGKRLKAIHPELF